MKHSQSSAMFRCLLALAGSLSGACAAEVTDEALDEDSAELANEAVATADLAAHPRTETAQGTLVKAQVSNLDPLNVAPGTALTVRMTGTGDADLYVRFDAVPTLSSFACRPFLDSSNENCQLTVPAAAKKVYVQARGYSSSANITIKIDWMDPDMMVTNPGA